MLNLNEVSGIKSSPISENILENSVGLNNMKDSRAFANYEFMLDKLTDGSFKAPSVILASGKGDFYPKSATYQSNFYSSMIFGRDEYLNTWQLAYSIGEAFELTYYDGTTVFKQFKIEPSNGRAKIRSVELRNGNLPGQAGYAQLIFGYNAAASINDSGYYRHNFRSRHSESNNNENVIDIFLWDKYNDSKNALGSRRVLSLYGNGNSEIVNGSQIFGPVNISIVDEAARIIERDTLAAAGKGVIYYNQNANRFRYSENGSSFKYFGDGGSTNDVYYTTLVDKVFDYDLDNENGGAVVPLPDVYILHAGFEIDNSWAEGEVKSFIIRGIVPPLKINPVNNSLIIKSEPLRVVFELEDSNLTGYVHDMTSYSDEHVITVNASELRKDLASYNIDIQLIRKGANLSFVSSEYRIPYYFEDTEGGEYHQGELTYRQLSSVAPRPNTMNMLQFSSGPAFSGMLLKLNLTIGSDWTLNTSKVDCQDWTDLFQASADTMYLTIKTETPAA